MKQWITGWLGEGNCPKWAGPLLTLLDVALILLAAWTLSRLSRRILGRAAAFSKRNRKIPLDDRKTDTILSVAAYIVRVVIWFTAVVTILYQLGLSGTVGSLLATAGIGGIALGLGAQSLVRDYVGGFFLILDNRLSVGDFVTVGDVTGTVESLTLRTTQIRSWRGELHTIPNGEIRQVANMSRGGYLAVVDMSVSFESDIDRACLVLGEEAARWAGEHPGESADAPRVLGVVSFGESDIVIRTMIQCAAPAHFAVERELRRRFKLRFDAEGIEIPYPRRTILLAREDRL